MDFQLRLAHDLYRRAVNKAGGDRALADVVRDWIRQYVDGTTPQALGGKAAASRLTPEERRARARRAIHARWARAAAPLKPKSDEP